MTETPNFSSAPAVVIGGAPRRPSRRWWKIYFWFSALGVLLVLGVPFVPSQTNVNYLAYLTWPIDALAIAGVGSYAYSRRFLNQKLWRGVFVLNVTSQLAPYVFPKILQLTPQESFSDVGAIGGFVFTLLQLWGLWRYAWRSPDIFQLGQPSRDQYSQVVVPPQ